MDLNPVLVVLAIALMALPLGRRLLGLFLSLSLGLLALIIWSEPDLSD